MAIVVRIQETEGPIYRRLYSLKEKDPTMTKERMRVVLAEWMGWKWYRIPYSEKDSRAPLKTLFHPAIHEIEQSPYWLKPGLPGDRVANMTYMEREGLVPNYPDDLNAIHECCSKLNDAQWWLVDEWLERNNSLPAIRADATQFCKAVLHVIGRWEEDAK